MFMIGPLIKSEYEVFEDVVCYYVLPYSSGHGYRPSLIKRVRRVGLGYIPTYL